MKKITTLFKKNPENLGRVIDEIDPKNEWVLKSGVPTRKFDGTACAIKNGELYKRYDAKINKKTGEYKKNIPIGAIPCQEADKITGHHPHWIKCERQNPEDKYHFEGYDNLAAKIDGTYELIGEKVQGNPEKVKGHHLIQHGIFKCEITDFSFGSIKRYLMINDMEGIVFHDMLSNKMCKIRKSDFGIKR